VKAMIDIATRPSVAGGYLSATTGDYDLFAVFPKRTKFAPTMDKRMVPGSDRFKQPISKFIGTEDPEMGNMTMRLRRIVREINALANHPGGDIVHHSDEAGRPLIKEIDFPFIAWIPGTAAPVGVRDVADFKSLIAMLGTDYVLALNPGWFRQL